MNHSSKTAFDASLANLSADLDLRLKKLSDSFDEKINALATEFAKQMEMRLKSQSQ